MNNKKTVLKTIEQFFKRHNEDNIKKEKKDKSDKIVLKFIDKVENIEDRTTDTTFPTPSEPVVNGLTEDSSFRTNKVDYEIEDLTKQEDIAKSEVQPPIDDDININSILNNLDKQLDESEHNQVLNILTTRSSKDQFRESALLEYTVYDRSYVLSLIVEKEEDKYKCTLKSSYGKEIYSKVATAKDLAEAIYLPFEAIALRDKYKPVVKEAAFVGLNNRQKSYLKALATQNPDVEDWSEFLDESDEYYDRLSGLQSNDSWTKKETVEVLKEYSK